MAATLQDYAPKDFVAVRDMLSETFASFGQGTSWRIERWNYARPFLAPMLAHHGLEPCQATMASSRRAISTWESQIGLWRDDGRVVGVVCLEHPLPWDSDAFFQRRPGYDGLLGEMIDYAEATHVHPNKHTLVIWAYDGDTALQKPLSQRGYARDREDAGGYDSVCAIDTPPVPRLPDGYRIQSMADENDIDRRCEALGRAFGHVEPRDWPSRLAYLELQQAPDYAYDRDLYVVAPDGRWVSVCIAWYDARNRIGILEPVGTHPDVLRLGLGRAVIYEAVRRVAALGAEAMWVGSGQPFYLAIGFRRAHASHAWRKSF